MSTLQAEVYEAFRALEVPDDKALNAAVALLEAMTKVEDETVKSFSKRDADMEAIRKDITSINLRMAGFTGDINLMKWMMGTLTAGVVTVIFRVFTH